MVKVSCRPLKPGRLIRSRMIFLHETSKMKLLSAQIVSARDTFSVDEFVLIKYKPRPSVFDEISNICRIFWKLLLIFFFF